MGTSERFGYLGPAGTFSDAARRVLPRSAAGEAVPFTTVSSCLAAVRAGKVDGAVVPMENSLEGSVNATLDELSRGQPLVISHEVVLPVSFAMLVRPGTVTSDVRRVTTHPHAEAQCRAWLAANLPEALVVPATSTAAAAAAVADPGSGFDAAVSSAVAGEHYGLVPLATGIQDADAHTRFVLVTRPGSPPAPTGADKTSLVVYLAEDRTGALLEILEQFATRGVNLTRIESRPVGSRLGQYTFSIDCEGHVADARVGEALMGLHRVSGGVRFLGSYARADGAPAVLAEFTTNADFAEAASWLAVLRGQSSSPP